MRELLNLQSRREGGERGKPSLSQVRIEQFKGNRDHYKEWKRTLEAQRSLYRLEDGELAMLIYLSTSGEARAILNQLEISEMREEGGLSRVLKLLDESFGARSDERFEQRQEEYLQFRRTPGMSISAFISTLKRLRTEYLREDEQTVISDKAFAQRMLTRAGLSRRERMDVFFSSGGKYVTSKIEGVLRFRCANVHLDEKRGSSIQTKYGQRPRDERWHPTKPRRQMFPKRSDRKHHRPTRHHTHVADQEDDEPNEPSEEEEGLSELDREDFEQEALAEGGDYGDDDYEEDIPEEDYEDEEWETVENLKDAYAAGWRAKSQAAEQRKGRGYKKGKGKGSKGPKKERAPDDRKKNSRCSSCKQMGHWHGDAVCPNVISGKDPPREGGGGASQVNYTEGGQASGSNDTSGRVHRVNWSFMVNHGWELLDHYASEGEESSEESESSEDPVLTAAPTKAEKPSSSTRRRRYKVALKTVLEALAAETDDEETQRRLKKKEYKAARQEAKRQKEREHEDKRQEGLKAKRQGSSPMDTTASPLEMLRILPHMTKEEKKELYKALKREQEEEAAKYLDLEASDEKLRRPDRRTAGYSAARPAPKPKAKAEPERPSSSAGRGTAEVPEVVRRKRLQEFRRTLYKNALDRKGKVKVSEASDLPTPEQEVCPHPWLSLKWGANGSAHWAHCKDCKMKRVLYYSNEHGALMTAAEAAVFLDGGATSVILDTGCRTAVAGSKWHQRMQDELRALGLPWEEVSQEEVFRFGAGAPVMSTRAMIYPITLGGTGLRNWLRISEVENTASDNRVDQCPALVGPSELARWKVVFNFADGKVNIDGQELPMQLSQARHPVLPVVAAGDWKEWSTPQLAALKEILMSDPYSLALLQENLPELELEFEREAKQKAAPTAAHLESSDEEYLGEWQEELEAQTVHLMDSVLGRMPSDALKVADQSDTTEDSEGSLSEGESESSHDAGWEGDSESTSESESEVEDRHEVMTAETGGGTDVLAKGQRRRLLDAVHKVLESIRTEVDERKSERIPRPLKRPSGKLKVLEIFTWTCMLSMVAYSRGNWEFYEPISLESGWDLEIPQCQEKAMAYLEEVDPDLLMIAWPCAPWSILQNANQRTPTQRRLLKMRRMKARRTLLAFTRRAMLWQRRRGKAVAAENPATSRAWDTPEIQEATDGLSFARFDQCQMGLQHPENGKPLKKLTQVAGQKDVVQYLDGWKCPGDHEHHPIEGTYTTEDGHRAALSEFAGGYPPKLCHLLLDGAEAFYKKNPEVYVEEEYELDELVPEPVDGDEAIEEEDQLREQVEEFPAMKKKDEDALEEEQRHPISREVRKAVEYAHRQLGHPSRSTLVRMMKLSGANKDAIRYAQRWRCDVCAMRQRPRRPQAAAASVRPYGFNIHLHIDLKFVHDVRDKRYAVLSILDLGTIKHDAVMIKTRRSDYVAGKFMRHWIMLYGVPKKITHDQGGEFEQSFTAVLEQFAITSEVTAAHAGWQLAAGERHGELLGTMLQAVVQEHSVEGYKEMKLALSAAVMAKNNTISRDGYTPNQRVFGTECRWPSLTDEDCSPSFAEAVNTGSEVDRAHRMRVTARVALLRQDVREKMKRAILRKPATAQGPFSPGAQVYFWTPGPRSRYSRVRGSVWRGPATVLVQEKHKRYFVSWRGRLLLLAEENMRLATKEELAMTEPIREEVLDLQGMLRDPMRSNAYEDLREVKPPPKRRKYQKRAPEPEHRKAAKRMMSGTKSVRRLLGSLQAGEIKRSVRRKVVKKRREPRRVPAQEEEWKPEVDSDADPSIAPADEQPPEVVEEEMEIPPEAPERSEEVPIQDDDSEVSQVEAFDYLPPHPDDVILEQRVKEQWQRMESGAKRQRILDDVPRSLKRKLTDRDDEDHSFMPEKKSRVSPGLVMQVLKATTEDGSDNEWVTRYELMLLRQLTGLPDSSQTTSSPKKEDDETTKGHKQGSIDGDDRKRSDRFVCLRRDGRGSDEESSKEGQFPMEGNDPLHQKPGRAEERDEDVSYLHQGREWSFRGVPDV